MKKSKCHPERDSYCKGLCKSCYRRQHYLKHYKQEKEYGIRNRGRKNKYNKEYYLKNRIKALDYSKKHYIKNKDQLIKNYNPYKEKFRKLRLSYNLSENEYKNILLKQHFKCGICKMNKKLGVDHDHKTNKFRGLICHNCNTALGLIGDNINTAINIIKYLAYKAVKLKSEVIKLTEDQKQREANLYRRLMAEGLISVPDYISKLREIDESEE